MLKINKHKARIAEVSLIVVVGSLIGVTQLFPTISRDVSKKPEVVETFSSQEPPRTVKSGSASSDRVGTNATSTKKSSNIDKIAPRQKELSKLVTNEIEYQLLAAVNDPMAQDKWHQNVIKAPQAWDSIDQGSQSVVAVLDSGFALNHEDLSNKWTTNNGEYGLTSASERCWTGTSVAKQSNDCDDDNNGYVDDWRGWDFYYVDNNARAGSNNPNGNGASHGTEVAGLVGAEANNSKGVASVGYTNKIMPLQVMNDDGVGYTSDIIAAVYYAVDNGADVINMSFGSAYNDGAFQAALQYAYDRDVVIVAASGNCGQIGAGGVCSSIPVGTITYPASYNTVIAVGATTQSGQRASFSSSGPALDLVAPGSGSIPSTTWTSSNQTSAYVSTLYGTSFSSPITASIAGMIRSQNPSLNNKAVKAALVANSDKISALNGQLYDQSLGHGLVDANHAVLNADRVKNTTMAPKLLLTGNEVSESRYTLNAPIGTGCEINSPQWCTTWMRSADGYDRYLPYTQATDNQSSWSWNTNILYGQNWQIRTMSANQQSPGKWIFNKDQPYKPL